MVSHSKTLCLCISMTGSGMTIRFSAEEGEKYGAHSPTGSTLFSVSGRSIVTLSIFIWNARPRWKLHILCCIRKHYFCKMGIDILTSQLYMQPRIRHDGGQHLPELMISMTHRASCQDEERDEKQAELPCLRRVSCHCFNHFFISPIIETDRYKAILGYPVCTQYRDHLK